MIISLYQKYHLSEKFFKKINPSIGWVIDYSAENGKKAILLALLIAVDNCL